MATIVPPQQRFRDIPSRLIPWYKTHGRSLPWRSTTDPYKVLLSEVMLQQTQVQRVLELYPRFLRRFPSVRSLAVAPRRSVVRAWQGMGYNNRAVRLHRLARELTQRNHGQIPDSRDQLVSLPGIGPGTASAILAFAFRRPVPILEVNTRRVLSRLFWPMHSTSELRSEKNLQELSRAILPRRRSYDWNQALMDLGATVCTARAPRCGQCPLARRCRSRLTMRLSVRRTRKDEPAFAGIPRRIYRGRMIEELRHAPGGRPLPWLRQRVSEPGKLLPAEWFSTTLRLLGRDGLIRLRTSTKTGITTVHLA